MEIFKFLSNDNLELLRDNLNFEVLEESDEFGDTILHKAVECNSPAHVQLILDSGADINTRNKKGNTPVHLAARLDLEDIFELLLDYGADLSIRNNSQRTPEDLSMMAKDKKVFKLISNLSDEWGYTEKIQSHRAWID